MSDKIETVVIENQEEDSLIVKLSREYKFEGETYNEIDLHGLEDLTGKDMIVANKQLLMGDGDIAVMPEFHPNYLLCLASRATKLPSEFFDQLKIRDATRVRNAVSNFILSEG